ncbi:MAG: DUF697 domain-containing protein [Ignavibacteriales bacterium]|jgi:uncharacterized protein (DUF697 family)|nr:DUF697 domain-containing protein [Ignavibacteriales bacterium]
MKDISNEVIKETKEQPAVGISNSMLANSVVNKYTLWSAGAGLIPVPALDMAAVAGFQVKMLSDLSDVYKVQFSENAARAIIAALTGSLSAGYLAQRYGASFIKSIPFLGFLSALAMPIYSGAITWAIGKVFVKHFESGGTFLTFDVEKMKVYFSDMYKQGKAAVKSLRAEPAKA